VQISSVKRTFLEQTSQTANHIKMSGKKVYSNRTYKLLNAVFVIFIRH